MMKTLNAAISFAAIASATVSPSSLNSDISIIIHNDLMRKNPCFLKYHMLSIVTENTSSFAGSGVLLLDPMPLQKAIESCKSLGESLWTSQTGFSQIKSDLNYLTFQGKYTSDQRYWISSLHNTPSTINGHGKIQKASANTHLPVLCHQSAPYSDHETQDNSSAWRVSVHSNNEYLTGYARHQNVEDYADINSDSVIE